jgi:hypothetical protein
MNASKSMGIASPNTLPLQSQFDTLATENQELRAESIRQQMQLQHTIDDLTRQAKIVEAELQLYKRLTLVATVAIAVVALVRR